VDLKKYLNEDYIIDFCKKIDMPKGALDVILSLQLDIDEANRIYSLLKKEETRADATEALENLKNLKNTEHGDLMCVLIYIAAAGYTHEEYKKLGIPDEIFYKTLSCLSEHIITYKNVNGVWGMKSVAWPISHINLKLFRLNRLSFAMNKYWTDDIVHNGETIIKKNEDFLAVHIPANDKLEGLKESYDLAREFFHKYFPDFNVKYFHCTTWLLYPGLANILPKTSNILAFQEDYTIYDEYIDNDEVLNRVWICFR